MYSKVFEQPAAFFPAFLPSSCFISFSTYFSSFHPEAGPSFKADQTLSAPKFKE